MRGHFYTVPPAFIGGRQPYAPRLGVVQGASAPDNPPPSSRIVLGIILAAWSPATFSLPPTAKIAPLISNSGVTAQPAPSGVNSQIIAAQWNYDPVTVITLPSIAPFLSAPQIDNPPAQSFVNRNVIAAQWYAPPLPLPRAVRIAPLIQTAAQTDSPPPRDASRLNLIIAQWRAPVIDLPKAGRVASILAPTVIPDNPPRYSTQWHIWRSWIVDPPPKQPRHLQRFSVSEFDVIVPYLIQDTLAAALARIAGIYCLPIVIGATGTVTAQDPPFMTVVPRGTMITITLGGTLYIPPGGNIRARPPYNAPDQLGPNRRRRGR